MLFGLYGSSVDFWGEKAKERCGVGRIILAALSWSDYIGARRSDAGQSQTVVAGNITSHRGENILLFVMK